MSFNLLFNLYKALAHVFLDYGDISDRPSAGVVANCDSGGGWHSAMYVSAYSNRGAIHSDGIGDFEFPHGALDILDLIREMVETKNAVFSYKLMVEPVVISAAARLAQVEGRKIYIKDVLDSGDI